MHSLVNGNDPRAPTAEGLRSLRSMAQYRELTLPRSARRAILFPFYYFQQVLRTNNRVGLRRTVNSAFVCFAFTRGGSKFENLPFDTSQSDFRI